MKKISLIIASCFLITSLVAAPKVSHISWGKTEITHDDGSISKYKDAKVYPSGSCSWNWKITGTEHVPGIQIEDVTSFIDEVDIVILTKGMDLELKTKSDTIDYISNKKGKELYMEQTEDAIKLYNTLIAQGKKVGMLIHSTC